MRHFNQRRESAKPCRRNLIAIFGAAALALGCVLLLLLGSADSQASNVSYVARAAHVPSPQPAGAVRIGTYDSRAVAVAYARSEQFGQKLQELRRQRSEAAKSKDKKRAAELDSQGESMQIRMNLQGFSTAPVDDVLDAVRDRLPAVAQQKEVAAIVRAADYHMASAELVDVTDELVRLFKPDAQTLKIVSELRKQKPLAIEEAAKMPAKP